MLRRLQRLFVRHTITGYEHPALLDEIFRKTMAYAPTEPWTLVQGVRTVLDFGGGCGVHYKRACLQSQDIRWAVVETRAMVAQAMALRTQRLQFFSDIASAATWLGHVDLMHSDGAVQYAADPMAKVRELVAVGAEVMYWDRLHFGEAGAETQVSFLGDNGPGAPASPRARVRYTRTTMNMAAFMAEHRGYCVTVPKADRFLFYR